MLENNLFAKNKDWNQGTVRWPGSPRGLLCRTRPCTKQHTERVHVCCGRSAATAHQAVQCVSARSGSKGKPSSKVISSRGVAELCRDARVGWSLSTATPCVCAGLGVSDRPATLCVSPGLGVSDRPELQRRGSIATAATSFPESGCHERADAAPAHRPDVQTCDRVVTSVRAISRFLSAHMAGATYVQSVRFMIRSAGIYGLITVFQDQFKREAHLIAYIGSLPSYHQKT